MELKNNFLKSRMNKDLDERLIPNGEYRDALNIEVSASEGSHSGTVQNLIGNQAITDFKLQSSSVSPGNVNYENAEVVGSHVDKPNDKIYYFVKNYCDLLEATYNGAEVELGTISDCILEYDDNRKQIDFVFTDVHTRVCKLDAAMSSTNTMSLQSGQTLGVEVGMRVEAILPSGLDYWGGVDVRVTSVSVANDEVTLSSTQTVPQAQINLGLLIRFTKQKLLHFRDLHSRQITGINVLDNNLFFTDNISEPKSINIRRSKHGTTKNEFRTTLSVRNSTTVSGGLEIIKKPVEKEEICVIKPNPQEPLTVEVRRSGEIQVSTFTTTNFDAAGLQTGDLITITIALSNVYEEGDVIQVADIGNDDLFHVEVIEHDGNDVTGTVFFIQGDPQSLGSIQWGVSQIEQENLFKNKFVRFAYRYVYEEEEVSAISPFTQAIHSVKINQNLTPQTNPSDDLYLDSEDIRLITLTNFVAPYMPVTVKAIDILMKLDNEVAIYKVAQIERGTDQFGTVTDGTYQGKYVVKTDVFGSLVESNQILRPYDNVPIRALAQETTANRILFANYVQGHDLIDSAGKIIEPEITAGIKNLVGGVSNRVHESVKSGRNYQVGVVYRDDMGRESPILTSSESLLRVGEEFSSSVNRIYVNIKNKAPYWATSYKIYVKDVSAPFEILPIMFALVGNDAKLYLGFNKSDRWKIQEGDVIKVKKAHNKNNILNTKVTCTEIFNGPTQAIQGLLNMTTGDGNDLFFVKTSKSGYQGLADTATVNSNPQGFVIDVDGNGYVETIPQELADPDLFFEASQAYPIQMGKDTAEQYIKEGCYVTGIKEDSSGTLSSMDAASGGDSALPPNQDFVTDEGEVYVSDVICASDSLDENVEITLDTAVTLTIPTNGRLYLRFHIPNRENSNYVDTKNTYVTGELSSSVSSSTTLYLKKVVHRTSSIPSVNHEITIPWFNCYTNEKGVEVMRIGTKASEKFLDKGVRVSTTFDQYQESRISNGFIFSGILNPGILNKTNQFIAVEPITKLINKEHGPIQKLHSRNTDVVTLCEDKCLKVLANKDAIFNADGNPNITSNAAVLGQAIPFQGNFGISRNPESFATYGYRSYFTDRTRGAVIRLSMDGLTVISDQGMKDWFHDNLKSTWMVPGSFDDKKQHYNITLRKGGGTGKSPLSGIAQERITITWNELTGGWESFKSFHKSRGESLNGKYFTWQYTKSALFLHRPSDTYTRNSFYGIQYNSHITTVFNSSPETVKSFRTLGYEGSDSRVIQDLSDYEYYNNTAQDGWFASSINTDMQEAVVREFKNKEGKWWNYIHGPNTTWTNFDGNDASGNLDTQEFSVQGIGALASTSGTIPVETFDFTLDIVPVGYYAQFVVDPANQTQTGITAGSATPTQMVFVINPLPGWTVYDPTDFSAESPLPSEVSSVTFTSAANGGATVTVNFNAITFNSNVLLDLEITPSLKPKITELDNDFFVVKSVEADSNETITIDYGDNFSSKSSSTARGFDLNAVDGFVAAGEQAKAFTITLEADSGYHYSTEPYVEIKSETIRKYRVITEEVEKDSSGRVEKKVITIDIIGGSPKTLHDGDSIVVNRVLKSK